MKKRKRASAMKFLVGDRNAVALRNTGNLLIGGSEYRRRAEINEAADIRSVILDKAFNRIINARRVNGASEKQNICFLSKRS